MNIDKERLIRDFQDLLSLPQARQVLFHKIEEIKMYNEDLLTRLAEIKSKIKPKPFKGDKGQPFQLFLIKKKWVPAIGGIDDRIPYDILPESLIFEIVKEYIDPGEIRMKRHIEIEGIKAVVSYEKIDNNCFSGIIETWKEERPTAAAFNQIDKDRLRKIEVVIDCLLSINNQAFEYFFKELKFFEKAEKQVI